MESQQHVSLRTLRLRAVLTIALVLIVVLPSLPMALSAWWNYQDDVARLQTELMDTNRQIALLASRLAENVLSDVAVRLKYSDNVDKLLEFPAIAGVELLDANGHIVSSSLGDERLGLSLANVGWRPFEDERAVMFSLASPKTETHDSQFRLAVRVRHDLETGQGAYRVAWLKVGYLHQVLTSQFDSPMKRHVYAVDGNGLPIFYTDLSLVADAARFADNKPVSLFVSGGQGEVRYVSTINGRDRLGYVLPMASTGWGMIVSADIAERMIGLKDRMFWLAAAVLLAGVLAVGVLAIFSRMVITPLIMLARNIRRRDRLAGEPLQVNFSGARIAEFQLLVDEINAHSLERLRAEEKTVVAEKLATLGEMAAGLAHEIGTPLNVMRGNAQLMQRRLPPDDPNRVVLDKIIHQTMRIADLIRGLLDLARADKDEFTRIDIGSIAERALDSIASLYPGVETTLTVERSCPEIRGRAKAIEHALLNLMVNACQAMEGKGTLKVEVRFGPGDRHLIVSVADSGCGISEEDLPKIFQPFFSTKGSGKGSGLGLAMVDRVMREHNGRIDVDSSPGRGARFDLFFTLEKEAGEHDTTE